VAYCLAKGKNLAEAALAAARVDYPAAWLLARRLTPPSYWPRDNVCRTPAFAAAGGVLPPSPYAADALVFAKRVANGQNIQQAALSVASQRAVRQVRNAAVPLPCAALV
jgi:hypothetical protein